MRPNIAGAQDAPRTPLSAPGHVHTRLGPLVGEFLAGLIVSALNIALAISFAALIFQGDLKDGIAIGLWSFLMSMVVTGVVVGLATSMPPIGAGPDTPTVAVMTLLATAVSSQILTLGGSAEQAVRHTMLAFSIMTVLSGALVYFIGALRLGQSLRFVPYPVVSGFLAATGCLMMIASYKMIVGQPLTLKSILALTPDMWPKIVMALAFAIGLLLARSRIKASYLMPAAFFGLAAAIDLFLWRFDQGADTNDWFIGGIQSLKPWFPFAAAMEPDVNWIVLLKASPEILTCVIVGIISLVVKVSGVETSRAAAADFNQEFRANGGASLLAAPVGALAGSLLVSASKAFIDAGARTRFSGIIVGAAIGIVVLTGVNLAGFVPKPLLAGLLVLLGWTMLADAVKGALNQRSWWEFVLALGIAGICLHFGYIAGVLMGLVCACLMFAFSYGRTGVVRRQLTRASFAGDVERAPEVERLLRDQGKAIQLYWLSGYIFFGSSEGLFERVRRSVESETAGPVRFVLLDFAGVSGIDSSTILSLLKLKSFSDKRGIAIGYSGVAVALQSHFEAAGLFGKSGRHRCFSNHNEALHWSEEQLLSEARPRAEDEAPVDFGAWLSHELECPIPPVVMGYFNRRELRDGQTLYRQGDPANAIDFVASGVLAIVLDDGRNPPRRIRRSTRQTVLGEMGFFRNTQRAAAISAEGPAVIYSLDRPSLKRMQEEHPEVYEHFMRFVIRVLADRLEFAHKEIAALT